MAQPSDPGRATRPAADTPASAAARSDVFVAVADESRRRILHMLREGERSVSELAGAFPVTRSAVSQHLRILRDAGLVSARKEGRARLYRLEPAPLREVVDWLAWFEGFWDEKLAALSTYLEEDR